MNNVRWNGRIKNDLAHCGSFYLHALSKEKSGMNFWCFTSLSYLKQLICKLFILLENQGLNIPYSKNVPSNFLLKQANE
jgi:hypothetical protein